MQDKLIGILKYFSLRARVFQAGVLCNSANYDQGDGLGYIHILQTGVLKVKIIGKKIIQLKEPSLLLCLGPISHQLHPTTTGTSLVCASFDFGNKLKNPLAQSLPEVLVLKLSKVPSLDASLQLLFSESKIMSSGQQALLDRLIEVVIIQILRELIDQNHMKIGLLAGLAEPRLEKAISAIHNSPAKQWTLDKLACIAGMSRSRFSENFRNIVGITPGHYLTEWRIGVAQSLLLGGKSLQIVSHEVGYANASALSRAFTVIVGASPACWRKRQLIHLSTN